MASHSLATASKRARMHDSHPCWAVSAMVSAARAAAAFAEEST
eukprot:CAMPEP_0180814134 /NCGR_PEP_ID=MMETSP1038_2-20121128/66907_1 /TAXON_ID=632150 /ORGANISM="Azadinium spinosum, Strain 3D9" /LENGTH=42 /DNA_ID= /DNA_START= /DNA_END= /DNA_ORIENTATION=